MKRFFLTLIALSPMAAFSQSLWVDNFDSLSTGNLAGQNGWLTTVSPVQVVTGGGTNPPADSGQQMASNQPTSNTLSSGFIFAPPIWANRQAGNDTLVLRGSIFVSNGTNNLGSAILQVVGTNPTAQRMGFVGIAAGKFIFGTGDNILFGSNATLDQWNTFRLEVDTAANSSKFFANENLLGTQNFTSGLALNNWGFATVALNGDLTKPVFYDTMSVEAVPEPASLAIIGASFLAIIKARGRQKSK